MARRGVQGRHGQLQSALQPPEADCASYPRTEWHGWHDGLAMTPHRQHHPTAYWWSHKPNLGDRLTGDPAPAFANLDLAWAHRLRQTCGLRIGPRRATSRLDGVVAGAGKLHADYSPLARSKVLGLRGQLPLQRRRLSSGNVVIGDPASWSENSPPSSETCMRWASFPTGRTRFCTAVRRAFENHPHIFPKKGPV